MTKLSGGILISSLHRVMCVNFILYSLNVLVLISLPSPPPGLQASNYRWSLVYFARPNDDVPLRPLSSTTIEEHVAKMPPETFSKDNIQTAKEWFRRRVRNQMVKNQTVRVFTLLIIERYTSSYNFEFDTVSISSLV